MTYSRQALNDDIQDVLGGCQAIHEATQAMIDASESQEAREMFKMGMMGTSMGLDNFRAYLTAHGLEENPTRRNALVGIATDCTAVAKEGDQQRMVSHYLRSIHYALGGYNYYVSATKALGDEALMEKFAGDIVNLERGLAGFESFLRQTA